MKNLVTDLKVVHVKAHTTAATGDVESSIVDTAGFDNCAFLATVGTAAADNLLKVEGDEANAAGGMKELATQAGGVGKTTLLVEIHRPRQAHRYLRAVVERGTSTTCESIYALLWNGRQLPVTQLSAVDAVVASSPAEV